MIEQEEQLIDYNNINTPDIKHCSLCKEEMIHDEQFICFTCGGKILNTDSI